MESLIIPEGQSTPAINFDTQNGKFEINGNSLPEDVLEFYSPVFKWVEQYIRQPGPIAEIHIKLSYFNSSSSKAILDILTMFEALTDMKVNISVVWHYLDLDEDMLHTGKEFEGMLKLPFQFVTYFQE
jgi:hypothetical protein